MSRLLVTLMRAAAAAIDAAMDVIDPPKPQVGWPPARITTRSTRVLDRAGRCGRRAS
jgi:hypothetical protein